MNDVEVSVIIPTFERGHLLQKAVDSVLGQSFKKIEILVVDDNIDAQESIKVQAITNKCNKVRYVKNYRSKGGCGARNSGILEAKGEFIAFLDDDDFWLNNKISEQVDAINNNKNVVLVSCDFIKRDIVNNTESVRKFSSDKLTQKDFFKGKCPASSSLILVKKKILLDAGLFDENLPSFQDFDMWIRCLEFGYLINVSKPLAVFVEHDGERTSINLQKRLEGLQRIIKKWRSEINEVYSVKRFSNKYKSSAYYHKSKKTVGISKSEALKWNLKSIALNPVNINAWRLMVKLLFK